MDTHYNFKCKNNGKTVFTLSYVGDKRQACKCATSLVFTMAGNGDPVNGDICTDDVFDAFFWGNGKYSVNGFSFVFH